MSSRPALLLLHGVTNSARIWDEVVPLLSPDFDLIVPTARGHRGGAQLDGPISVAVLVDDVAQLLDDMGLDAVHVAGNSLGGWVGLELARRGRALSVCALSPAGFWTAGADDETHATNAIRRTRALAHATRWLLPLAMRSAFGRRMALRDVAVRGDRLTPEAAVGIARDLIECTAAPTLLGTREPLLGFDTAPCPITLAWSEHDRIFPPEVNGATARTLIPHATYVVVQGAGHVPMIDDPVQCADIIRASAQPDGARGAVDGPRPPRLQDRGDDEAR